MDTAVQTSPPPPAGARRRKFVILVASMVLLSAGYLAIEANHRDAANEALNDLFRPKSPPPARMMVCEGVMDSACAQDAANQAFITFAWLDEPAGYELAWVIATGDPKSPDGPAIASEYLLGSDGLGMIEVVTALPAIEVEPGTPPTSSVSNGTDTASVWVDREFGLVSMEWTHEGIGYVLTAQPRPWEPTTVVEAWKAIRYTSPNPA
jgi:hypothetical protein